MSALLPKVAIDKGATSGAVEVIKRKDIRALFCAAHLLLNTLVDEFDALVGR